MSTFCIPFDPTSASSGTLDTKQGSGGTLWVFNDSAVNILFTLTDGGQKFCPAGAPRKIELSSADSYIAWKQQAILPLTVPNSQLYAESYSPSEAVPDAFLGPLVRGQVLSGSIVAQQLTNTGNPPGTSIITTNVAPAAGTISVDNDGTALIKLEDSGIITQYLSVVPGGLVTPSVVQIGSIGTFQTIKIYASLAQLDSDANRLQSDGNGNLVGLSLDVVNASAATLPTAPNEGGMTYDGSVHALVLFSEQQGGVTTGIRFFSWNGSVVKELLSLGSGIGSPSVNIDNSGDVNAAGWYAGGQGNAGAITTGATLSPTGIDSIRCSPAGAVTGIIIGAGSVRSQAFTVINESAAANSITFAASGTSRVSDGVADVIAGLHARRFVWDAGTSLWEPCV